MRHSFTGTSIAWRRPGKSGLTRMTNQKESTRPCAICGKLFPLRHLISGELVRKELAAEICRTVPGWSPQMYICRPDLTESRGRYVHDLLESERGELSSLEQEV